MIPASTFDPSRRLDLYFRIKRAGSKSFIFLDENESGIDISGYDFELHIKNYPGERNNVLELTVGSGLTVAGTGNRQLNASITVSQSNLKEGEYYWELYKGSTDKTYLSGKAIFHNGAFDGVGSDSETLTIDDSGTVSITVSDSVTGEIPVVSFNTELTFDYDKDLATVSGGTRTFTLASSGHLNGIGIVARINDPVAVSFPVGFEAVEGSSSISTTDMNIIVFRYFDNYDGAGNDKVLYLIKNQTSV